MSGLDARIAPAVDLLDLAIREQFDRDVVRKLFREVDEQKFPCRLDTESLVPTE